MTLKVKRPKGMHNDAQIDVDRNSFDAHCRGISSISRDAKVLRNCFLNYPLPFFRNHKYAQTEKPGYLFTWSSVFVPLFWELLFLIEHTIFFTVFDKNHNEKKNRSQKTTPLNISFNKVCVKSGGNSSH